MPFEKKFFSLVGNHVRRKGCGLFSSACRPEDELVFQREEKEATDRTERSRGVDKD